ncbi:MAG: FprA family A-type flavoprotein [Bacteroidales bacterium]|nr:FprA family A-type flavoprotein [Bacteroidales bacterium]
METIARDIYYVGVNDRQKHLFENYLPIPNGVAYNSYLITDEKIALIDTVDISMIGRFLTNIDSVLQGRKIDYLVVNHMEPDHAGSIGLLAQKYPEMTIVGNAKTFDMLNGYFDAANNRMEVKEGESLNLGSRQLTFYMAPMVHWPEVMVAYEAQDQILFSADAFGTFGTLDGSCLDTNLNTDRYWDDMRRYYACIVGKFGKATQAALKKLSALNIKTICSTHGPVWQKDINKTVALYDKWSRYEAEQGVVVAYGTMYGNTEQLAEAFAQGVVKGGLKEVKIYNVSQTDASYILADVFKYKGLALGSPTYMNETYPLVESLMSKIEHRGIPDRVFACFGGHTWAGGSCKKMTEWGEKMKWTAVGNPVDNRQGAKADDLLMAQQLGMAMAKEILNQCK